MNNTRKVYLEFSVPVLWFLSFSDDFPCPLRSFGRMDESLSMGRQRWILRNKV